MTSLGRRACALVAVLAVLVGAIVPAASTIGGCTACAPGCPMHARRLGCHRAPEKSCHRAGPGVRSVCTHGYDATPAASLRGVVPASVEIAPAVAVRPVARPVIVVAGRPLPEPPTGPPRSSVV